MFLNSFIVLYKSSPFAVKTASHTHRLGALSRDRVCACARSRIYCYLEHLENIPNNNRRLLVPTQWARVCACVTNLCVCVCTHARTRRTHTHTHSNTHRSPIRHAKIAPPTKRTHSAYVLRPMRRAWRGRHSIGSLLSVLRLTARAHPPFPCALICQLGATRSSITARRSHVPILVHLMPPPSLIHWQQKITITKK